MEQSQHCTTTEICGPTFERKEDETNPQVKAVRSSKFWFEDGNVVLQAEHTQFRVHRSVLSMHCPIFRDMFACSQPENGPMIDGCPLVHFFESLEDVKNFSSKFSINQSRLIAEVTVKYEMSRLLDEALYCLKLEFPSSLERWSYQVFGKVIDETDPEDEERPTISLFEILYLAHEHSVTSILLTLYLRICLTHNAEEITEGFQCVAKKMPHDNRLLTNSLFGRERLHRSVSSLTLSWLYDNNALSSSDCQYRSLCQKKRSVLINKLWNSDIQFSLKFAVKPWERLDFSEDFCSSCSKAAKVAYNKGRTTNWDQLKTYFGLCDLRDGLVYQWEDDSDSSQSDSSADSEEMVED